MSSPRISFIAPTAQRGQVAGITDQLLEHLRETGRDTFADFIAQSNRIAGWKRFGYAVTHFIPPDGDATWELGVQLLALDLPGALALQDLLVYWEAHRGLRTPVNHDPPGRGEKLYRAQDHWHFGPLTAYLPQEQSFDERGDLLPRESIGVHGFALTMTEDSAALLAQFLSKLAKKTAPTPEPADPEVT